MTSNVYLECARRALSAGIAVTLLSSLAPAGLISAHAWPGVWSLTQPGDDISRHGGTATLLSNGRVLETGGRRGTAGATETAEVYDPVAGTWTSTGSMATARYQHTATLLPNGKVLVAGGTLTASQRDEGSTVSAELYDPATGTWSPAGSMATARAAHTATPLPDGRVLVAGGEDNFQKSSSAEIYDPVTGTWTATGPMAIARAFHTATLLPDGRVLVAGGGTDAAEIYDPATGTWTSTGPMSASRLMHTATLLPNGTVLVAGGQDRDSAEVYDPGTGTWTATGSMTIVRYRHTATPLSAGKVLVTGTAIGGNETFATAEQQRDMRSAEIYDPGTGTWTATESMTAPRSAGHSATLLPGGRVLVSGGFRITPITTGIPRRAELYEIAPETHPVTLTVALPGPGSGRVTSSPAGIHCRTMCSAGFVQGTKVTLTAARAEGSSLVWSGCLRVVGDDCIVAPTSDTTVEARFETDLHERNVSLVLRKRRALAPGRLAVGRISALDGYEACTAGVPVEIQRRTPAGWIAEKERVTLDDGTFRARLRSARGRYRAYAAAFGLEEAHTCSAARSRVVSYGRNRA